MSKKPKGQEAEVVEPAVAEEVLQEVANLGAAVDALVVQTATLEADLEGSSDHILVVDLEAEAMVRNLQQAITELCAAVSHLLDVVSDLQITVRVQDGLKKAGLDE